MGCAIPSRESNRCQSSAVTNKIVQKIIRRETIRSNPTNQESYSRMNSADTKLQCLNIKILPESHKIETSSFNLSGTLLYLASFEFVSDFEYIRSTFSSMTAATSFFYSLAHEVCFKRFEIADGLLVMMVSLMANRDAKIEMVDKEPFVEVAGEINKESREFLEAWKLLYGKIESVVKENGRKIRKCASRLAEFQKMLNESIESSIRPGRIQKAVMLCQIACAVAEETVVKAIGMKLSAENFFRRFNKKRQEYEKLAEKAADYGVYSGERIVHTLLCY